MMHILRSSLEQDGALRRPNDALSLPMMLMMRALGWIFGNMGAMKGPARARDAGFQSAHRSVRGPMMLMMHILRSSLEQDAAMRKPSDALRCS